jgi:hypothetical protein
MKYCFSFIFIIAVFLVGCQDEEGLPEYSPRTATIKDVPPSVDYDMNGDGINDFAVQYGKLIWDGVNSSGTGLTGRIRALGESAIFGRSGETELFLLPGDTVRRLALFPEMWDNFSPEIVSITDAPYNVWEDEWTIRGKSEQGFSYVGIKLRDNGFFSVGWLKIQADKETGDIRVIEWEFRAESEIVIDR